jgi:hypothetical protein
MLMICIISFCPDIPSVSQYTFLGLYTWISRYLF